ncbi:MAG TPA: NAD(P)H-dependent oxidoreductase [Syntrophales bacterium]|nr:NAD(P)H-dependent oxidoreductase [Syntrophales bacterium]
MNISLILAHPTVGSFNHAIASEVTKALRSHSHNVFFHDLYGEQFDPVLTTEEIPADGSVPQLIQKHCREIADADGIIVVHPNWWGQPPAILKGWVDRVIRPGVAYEFLEGDQGDGVPRGLLRANTAIVFNTSNTIFQRERDVFGDPLETLWKNCVFGLCGVKNVHRRMFGVVVTSSESQRREWLREVGDTVKRHFP